MEELQRRTQMFTYKEKQITRKSNLKYKKLRQENQRSSAERNRFLFLFYNPNQTTNDKKYQSGFVDASFHTLLERCYLRTSILCVNEIPLEDKHRNATLHPDEE